MIAARSAGVSPSCSLDWMVSTLRCKCQAQNIGHSPLSDAVVDLSEVSFPCYITSLCYCDILRAVMCRMSFI